MEFLATNPNKMKYIRQKDRPFSLRSLLDQVAAYVKDRRALPSVIFLPPEEFVYINILRDDFPTHPALMSFIGIPLDVTTDPQEFEFYGI